MLIQEPETTVLIGMGYLFLPTSLARPFQWGLDLTIYT